MCSKRKWKKEQSVVLLMDCVVHKHFLDRTVCLPMVFSVSAFRLHMLKPKGCRYCWFFETLWVVILWQMHSKTYSVVGHQICYSSKWHLYEVQMCFHLAMLSNTSLRHLNRSTDLSHSHHYQQFACVFNSGAHSTDGIKCSVVLCCDEMWNKCVGQPVNNVLEQAHKCTVRRPWAVPQFGKEPSHCLDPSTAK